MGLTRHPRELGAGVAVTRFWNAGSVDYKKIVERRRVDPNAYHGKEREEVRVSVAT